MPPPDGDSDADENHEQHQKRPRALEPVERVDAVLPGIDGDQHDSVAAVHRGYSLCPVVLNVTVLPLSAVLVTTALASMQLALPRSWSTPTHLTTSRPVTVALESIERAARSDKTVTGTLARPKNDQRADRGQHERHDDAGEYEPQPAGDRRALQRVVAAIAKVTVMAIRKVPVVAVVAVVEAHSPNDRHSCSASNQYGATPPQRRCAAR